MLISKQQANPLNTYLDSKPSFTSPKPLAAASGLTIPLSITLSDFKLSAFIILVFSKQKGLTIVFRNDPLESLKVSSTFDSIQFVRDYLQRTIEQQLRNLMMDELPAIIHRLSLQLWCPDQANKGSDTPKEELNDQGVDPFASPPDDPVDSQGNLLDPNAVSELTLNGEMQSLFSQKNLLRLAALTDSHRTLSLFTPGIRDVVFRAWTSQGDRSDPVTPALATPSLSRTHSAIAGNTTTYTFSDTGSASNGHMPLRPSLMSLQSPPSGLAMPASTRPRTSRKKKNRVVNLRRSKSTLDTTDIGSEATSETASVDMPFSEPMGSDSIPEEPEAETMSDVVTSGKVRFTRDGKKAANSQSHLTSELHPDLEEVVPTVPISDSKTQPIPIPEKSRPRSAKHDSSIFEQASVTSESSSAVREHAWVNKVAGEIARRVYDEKKRRGIATTGGSSSIWDEQEAPPAYEVATQ